MDSSKLTALLFILMLSISTIPQILACDYCPKPTPPSRKSHTTPAPPGNPINLPPVYVPPVGLPPLKPPFKLPPVRLPPLKPPSKVPPVGLPPLKPPFKVPPVSLPPLKPPFKVPPVGLPPLKPPYKIPPVGLPPLKPPFKIPPVGLPPLKPPFKLPPVGLPPLIGHGTTPPSPTTPCPSPPATSASCPIDALKFGSCVNVLGNSLYTGDPTVECCPVVDGLSGVTAAACLCTAIKAKLLDVNFHLPIALQVLVSCGSSVPAGYTCA